MNYYFLLQFRRLTRITSEAGFHPILAFFLSLLIFLVASNLIVNSLSYGSLIYAGCATYLASSSSRVPLIQSFFSPRQIRIIQLLNGLILLFPFMLFTVYSGLIHETMVMIFFTMLLSQKSNFNSVKIPVIPTPFSARSFEFLAGFRKNLLPLISALTLGGIAIYVSNFNLGVFAIVLIYLIISNFYSYPEDKFFVWNHSMNPVQFLTYKSIAILKYSLGLVIPISLGLIIIKPDYWWAITLGAVFGLLLPLSSMLSKYAYLPGRSDSLNAVLLGSCLLFPPLFLFVIPMTLVKATRNLTSIL